MRRRKSHEGAWLELFDQGIGKLPSVANEHVNADRGENFVRRDSRPAQDIAENGDGEVADENDDAAGGGNSNPGSWVKEKNESECHRDCGQNDRHDKQLFPRTESIRAGDENNGDEDVHHEHTPRQSNYRGGGDEREGESRSGARDVAILLLVPPFSSRAMVND